MGHKLDHHQRYLIRIYGFPDLTAQQISLVDSISSFSFTSFVFNTANPIDRGEVIMLEVAQCGTVLVKVSAAT